MWNFCEIFAANADKARLVTAVLSVVAAVLVVYLTHALIQRRNRMELRAKKMEEIYSAVTEFAVAGWKYMHKRVGPKDQNLETMPAYDEAYSKITMLASIYAADIYKDVEAMHKIVLLTKDGGAEDLSLFPGKLEAFVEKQLAIQAKIASQARKLVE